MHMHACVGPFISVFSMDLYAYVHSVCVWVCKHTYLFTITIDSHHGVHFKGDTNSLEEQEPQVAGADRGAPGDHQWN